MTMDKKGTYSPASDTTSYQSENDPYGIERRTHDVFVPPQLEDTSYVPHQDVKEAQGETQKRIARRRARSKRKKLARQRQLRRRNRRLAAAAGVVFVFLVWLILRFFLFLSERLSLTEMTACLLMMCTSPVVYKTESSM